MAQEKVKVLIIVSGGVVQHIECGNFVDAEVIDYDNAVNHGREWFAQLSPEAKAYVLADDPDFQLKYEDNEQNEFDLCVCDYRPRRFCSVHPHKTGSAL